MPKFSKKFLFALGVLIFFSLISMAASPANAQEETYKLSVPFGGHVEFTSPAQYIKAIYNFSLGIGSVLALLLIVIGGIRYTLSEAVTNKSDAKDQIRGAVIGLILLLTSFLILQTINPKITELEDPDLKPTEVITNLEKPPLCGNNILESPREQCEPPGILNNRYCNDKLEPGFNDIGVDIDTLCTINCECRAVFKETDNICGNGRIDPGEECDPPGDDWPQGCRSRPSLDVETVVYCGLDCSCQDVGF